MRVMFRILLTLLAISTTSIAYCQNNQSLIKFQELTVEIQGLSTLKSDDLVQVFKNEASFTADLGWDLDSTTILVMAEHYSTVEVYQAFETSIVISDEGPHCDLTAWKHFTSNWIKLKELKPSVFISASIDSASSYSFPKVKMSHVAEAAKKACGERWADHIKNTKSIYDYPCDVGISTFFLKIIAKEKVSGKQIKKIIRISVPMGC
jgi:hypothetical protein